MKAGLQARAERHGRSMEAEVRAILEAAVLELDAPLGQWLRRQAPDGLDLELPAREDEARAASFDR